MNTKLFFLYGLVALLALPSLAWGFSDDFETEQQWGIFEEFVGDSECYEDGIGEVIRSTDVAHNGSYSLRVWPNKEETLFSNHVIAQKKLADEGRDGAWRYEMYFYIGDTSQSETREGQTGPEMSMQNTRELLTGVFRSAISGVQYHKTPYSPGNWAIWTADPNDPNNAKWRIFFNQDLQETEWYYLAVEVDYTNNTYIRFVLQGPGVNVSFDLSDYCVVLEDKFHEEAFWISVEAENLYNNCGEAGAYDYVIYYDDINLAQLPETPSKTWYVDHSESVSGDGSEASPWQTIREAIEARGVSNCLLVREGDVVEIAPGTYSEQLIFNGGVSRPGGSPTWRPKSPNNNITFRSGGPGKVIVDGAGFSPRGECGVNSQWMGVVFQLGIKGIVLKDFEITGWDHYGVNLDYSDGITLLECDIHDNGNGLAMAPTAVSGIALATNSHISNSNIYDNTCNGMSPGGSGHVIGPQNHIYRNGDDPAGKGYGIQMTPGHGTNIHIYENDIYQNGQGVRLGGAGVVQNNHFYENTVRDNQWSGMVVLEPAGANSIVHNVISGNGGYGIVYHGANSISGLQANTIKYNRIASSAETAQALAVYLDRESFAWAEGEVFDYNAYTKSNAQFYLQTSVGSGYLDFYQWQDETDQDPNSRIGDVGTISGSVTTSCPEAPDPPEEVAVRLYLGTAELARTDADISGNYTFDLVPLGTYTATARPPYGYDSPQYNQTVTLDQDGETVSVDFSLSCLPDVVPTCEPEPDELADIVTLADWMKSLQFIDTQQSSHGAIKVHHDPGWRDPDLIPYYRVIPWRTNLGLLGLLRAPVPGVFEATEKWIEWYLDHLDLDAEPPGIIYDHWYLHDGSGESTCPPGIPAKYCDYDDASDSYAASFLGLLWTYYESGGSVAFLNTPGYREAIETVAGVITFLQDPIDGLTWNKNLPGEQFKYLMDNCEVYWGLRSMARLEEEVFGDATAATDYYEAAEEVRTGILSNLVHSGTSLYLPYLGAGTVELDTLYADAVAQVWPHLWGVTESRSEDALFHMAAFNEHYDGSPRPDWTTNIVDNVGQMWPSVGLAAILTGDRQRAQTHAEFIKSEKFTSFDYPWTVDDAGFLMRTLSSYCEGQKFIVTNTDDSGAGSLRQAILDAEAYIGLDEIHFDIDEPVPYVIELASALPAITEAVIIDGTTQPGFTGYPIIQLDGSGILPPAGTEVHGFTVSAAHSKIAGFRIFSFPGDGIHINVPSGVSNPQVGNLIGSVISANYIHDNAGAGVRIEGASPGLLANAISRNSLKSNGVGVALEGGDPTTVSMNEIVQNTVGLYLSSSGNAIYHNTVICIDEEIGHDSGGNTWDDPVNGLGNYWGKYIGTDNGSNGRIADDGIGDTGIPYLGVDNAPLMDPSIPKTYIPAYSGWWLSFEGGWSPVAIELIDPNGNALSAVENQIGDHAFYLEDSETDPSTKFVRCILHRPDSGMSPEGTYTLRMIPSEDLDYWLRISLSDAGETIFEHLVTDSLYGGQTEYVDIQLTETVNPETGQIQVDAELTTVHRSGVISGLVDKTCGSTVEPAAEVELYVLQDGEPYLQTTTDSTGHYSFTHLTLGSYTVGVIPPQGYVVPIDTRIVTLDEPEESVQVDFSFDCELGHISGSVTGSCEGEEDALHGVTVDVFRTDEDGFDVLVATDGTDSTGTFTFPELALGGYTVTAITPLGYASEHSSQDILVVEPNGTVTVSPLSFACINIPYQPRGKGYWKHQVNVYTTGKGKAQESLDQMLAYSDLIVSRFNENIVNPVIIYVPGSETLDDRLTRLQQLLTVNKGGTMVDRAKAQLLALLLNVVAEKISQTEVISEDGATVSQAITFCNDLIQDDDESNDEMAKNVADYINNGRMVPAGMIPVSTPIITYTGKSFLHGVFPNPTAGKVQVYFTLSKPGPSRVEVIDIRGRRIRTQDVSAMGVGVHTVDLSQGMRLPAGIYFVRFVQGEIINTTKVSILR